MKHLLVPTDFSGCADNALDFAVESARLLPQQITLLHSLNHPDNRYTDYVGLDKEFTRLRVHDVNEQLAKLKANLQETTGLVINTSIVQGEVPESIVEAANEKDIDLIIMGTSGAKGIREKLWGTTTTGVIAKSTVPVLTIPTEYHWKKPQKILFATNHYERDPQVLETLMKVVDMYTAELHVVIVSVDNDDAPTFLEHCRETPHYEQMLKQKYGAAIHNVANLYGKSVEESLEGYITQNNIDLLAMVPYKRNFPKNIFFPSLTKHMACHTKIPLLALHVNQE